MDAQALKPYSTAAPSATAADSTIGPPELLRDARVKWLYYKALGSKVKEAWLNWMGVEPAFDPIRSDERFDQILEHTGYRMFFKNFSKSGINLDASGFPAGAKASPVHDLTTLVTRYITARGDGGNGGA